MLEEEAGASSAFQPLNSLHKIALWPWPLTEPQVHLRMNPVALYVPSNEDIYGLKTK
jgi:hypothetical protein